MSSISTSWKNLANAIRALSMDAIEMSQSGHPGLPMGMADVATVLFGKHLNFFAQEPAWFNRDRFVLSAGHGSMLLYSLLYLTGYADMTLDDLKAFRQLGSKTAGHPEFGYAAGVETTTGPLGQGLANAVGMALGESILRARHGEDVCSHHTYALVGDGCLMEGISQETISLAAHLKLSKLIVLFDDNQITIDGPTSLTTSENHLKRFEACGWNIRAVDGHDMGQIDDALTWAKNSDRPVLIACRTIIGYGAPTKSGTEKVHGSPLGAEETRKAREFLNWPYAPFQIPDDILKTWRSFGTRSHSAYEQWQQKNVGNEGVFHVEVPSIDLNEVFKAIVDKKPSVATRKSSEMVLETLVKQVPQLLGGSADLTGSNNTKASSMKPITPDDHSGNYIYYGIREHAMGAVMNGLGLHGGFIPYGGTFLTFTDYCRPAIRLSALMHQRVIYVMTHDSIGLGEDGPTHQPIEHLSSLRCIPNLKVYRPADTIETGECWALALNNQRSPSVMVLSRQNLPTIRSEYKENLSAKGGYILKKVLDASVTLIATGSEVSLALEVSECLKSHENISASVASMPCTEWFNQQDKSYQNQILGQGLRVFIEAGASQSWHRYARPGDLIMGIDSFGLSGPGEKVFDYFGFTAPKITDKIVKHLGGENHEKN